jgi:hypothetical protein
MVTPRDDLAIRNLVDAYSDRVGRRDDEVWRSTWMPDCVWSIRDTEVRGIDAAYALYSQAMSTYPRLLQTVLSGWVGARADGPIGGIWHLLEIQRTEQGEERMVVGRYEDTYAKLDGQWRFAERRFSILYRARIGAGLSGPAVANRRPGGASAEPDGAHFHARLVDPVVEVAVRNNVATYADAVTRRDMSLWRDTWADEGVWSFADTEFDGRIVGADNCTAFMMETLGWFPRLLQTVFSGHVFERADGRVGAVWHIVEIQHRSPGDERLVVGRYEDVYRQQGDRWVFAERAYRRLYGAQIPGGMLPL